MDKDKVRTHILHKALEMFSERGVSAVRMDDIARKLSVSKRTLYEMFSTKENLLLECVTLHCHEEYQLLEEQIASGKDVLTISLNYLTMAASHSTDVNPVFLEDMKKSVVLSEWFEKLNNTFEDGILKILKLGVSQGVFRTDVDLEVAASASKAIRDSFMKRGADRKFSMKQVFESAILVQLRGLSTPKGIELLENFKAYNK